MSDLEDIIEKEYKEYLRCRNCNRATPDGINDYRNRKTGSLTKTCIKCRNSVYRSLAKKPRLKPTSQKDIMRILVKICNAMSDDDLKSYISEQEVEMIREFLSF
jgi:hypothetical protein